MDDDDSPSRFRTYCQTVGHDTPVVRARQKRLTQSDSRHREMMVSKHNLTSGLAGRSLTSACLRQVAPFLEERAHVLRLSLEKMRFIDDPEAFLRRSVLVNNLLRRLRAEILLQSSDWCFPPGPTFAPPPCAPPAGSSPTLHTAMPTSVCLAPQAGPPFRKRFRMLSGGQVDLQPDCAQTCCCIYAAAAAGHYLHLPFSMYDAALSSCTSTPHSSSLFQLGNHSKLGLTVAVEEHDEEEEDVEEEDDEEENEEEDCGEREEEEEEGDDDGRTPAGSSISGAKDKTSHQSRTKMFQVCAQTRTEEDMTEVEEEEQEEKEEIGRSCQWTSQKDLRKVGFWYRRAHRQ